MFSGQAFGGSLGGSNVDAPVSKKAVAASECKISQLVFPKTRVHPARCHVLTQSSRTRVFG